MSVCPNPGSKWDIDTKTHTQKCQSYPCGHECPWNGRREALTDFEDLPWKRRVNPNVARHAILPYSGRA